MTELGTKSAYQFSSRHKGHPVLIFQTKETQFIPLNTQNFSSMRAHEQIMNNVLIGFGGFFNHNSLN